MSCQSQKNCRGLLRGLTFGLLLEGDVVLFYFVCARALNLLYAWGLL